MEREEVARGDTLWLAWDGGGLEGRGGRRGRAGRGRDSDSPQSHCRGNWEEWEASAAPPDLRPEEAF